MTARQLFEAVGFVEDELVEQANAPVVRRRVPRQTMVMTAACLCLVVGVAGASGLGRMKVSSAAPASDAEYSMDSAPAVAAGSTENAAPEAAMEEKENDAATAALCPVDVTDYPLWAVCDRSGWEHSELVVNAGMLMVLTDADGAPFAAGQTLTVQADGAYTLGYAAQSGAPEFAEGETLTLPQEGYLCVLAGDADMTVFVSAGD